LEFKRDAISDNKSTINNSYTQQEIAQIMSDYYAQNGVTKTFSQAAINYRITTLNEKIKAVIDENPSLKAGFEYIYNYYQANSEIFNQLSNSREELDIRLDRETMGEKYADNDQEMNKLLSNGKTLNDIYDVNPQNPLDEELANSFRNY